MSYRTIYSVINEHTASTVTARYAISLAAACKAELVLYAANVEACDAIISRNTIRHLDHISAIASAQGINVTRIVGVGTVGTMLPKLVQAEHADLVLYPAVPNEKRLICHLLSSIRSDLAIIRAVSMAKPHPGRILVPLGNAISDKERLLLFVSEVARSFQAHVTLFHVSADKKSQEFPDLISQYRKQLQEQQVTVLERCGRGDVGKAIVVEAITRHNDLIILGTSGRGIMQRLFSGNPAAEVMLHPPCNTILFRAAP